MTRKALGIVLGIALLLQTGCNTTGNRLTGSSCQTTACTSDYCCSSQPAGVATNPLREARMAHAEQHGRGLVQPGPPELRDGNLAF